MSSIISDIFYNKKNANLLDHYLINRHQYGQDSVSNVLEGSVWMDGELDIGIEMKIMKTRDRFHRKDGFVAKAQLGNMQIQETSHPKNPTLLQFPISFNNIPISQIHSHSHIRLQFSANNHPIGFTYLPIENIKELALIAFNNHTTATKHINMKLKPVLQRNDRKNEGYKVECTLRVKKTQNNSYSGYNTGSNEMRREDSQNGYESYFGQSKEGESKKQERPSIIRSDNKQYFGRSSVKKQKYVVKQSAANEDEWIHLFDNSSNPDNNNTSNAVAKTNKPSPHLHTTNKQLTKSLQFTIQQYRPPSNFSEKQNVPLNICYRVKLRNQLLWRRNGESIEVWSDDYDKNGITIEVIETKEQIEQGEQISEKEIRCMRGTVGLNPVILLGGVVEGIFPVNAEETENCVGLLKIRADRVNNQKESDKSIKICTHDEEEVKQQPHKTNLSSFSIKFDRIFILPLHYQLDTKPQIPKIIVRINDNLACLSEKFIKIHATELEYYRILELKVNEPIKIIGLDHIADIAIVQIEIYLGSTNVGYLRKQWKCKWDNNAMNRMCREVWKKNLSVQGYISQSVMTAIRVDAQPKFLLPNKMNKTLDVLNHQIISEQIGHQYANLHHFRKHLIQKLMVIPLNLLFIECSRMADLFVQALLQSYCQMSVITQVQSPTNSAVKLFDELMYLDSDSLGTIEKYDLQAISEYYGIRNEQIEGSLADQKQGNKVLYLFLMLGLCVDIQKMEIKQNEPLTKQKVEASHHLLSELPQSRQQQLDQKEELIHKNNESDQKEQIKPIHQSYTISKIDCKNMKCLMPNRQIPSLKLVIGDYFTQTIHRSANPSFTLHQTVSIHQPIQLVHRDIKSDTQITLWQFTIDPFINIIHKQQATIQIHFTLS